MDLLKAEHLTMKFGGLTALHDLNFTIERGQIVSLIGPNGAGKTTFFNVVTGFYTPTGGSSIQFDGKELVAAKPEQITSFGIARTFQNIRLFNNMTALENVMVGQHCRMQAGVWGALSRNKQTVAEERQIHERAYHLLKQVHLHQSEDVLAQNLPYGEQRRLEIARALGTEPKLLLLDEPSAGMNPQETLDLIKLIAQLNKKLEITILLIEHDMRVVMNISDKVIVLDYGEKIAEGTPEDVQSNERVIEAYLGKKARNVMAILEVKNIHTFYGNIEALKGVSLAVDKGEIVTLIGSNGAGKSTTLNSICGITTPRKGEVYLENARIDHLPAHEIVPKGISQSPEGRKIFSRLTVMENLEMGAFIRNDGPDAIRKDIDDVFGLFPRLREREWQIAGTLSGGEQQMLAIGRALMSKPRILLLDEPSMGLAPLLVDAIFDIIETINRQGMTILLVEQNAQVALSIADRGYVMQAGEVVLQDTAKNLQENEMVRRLYLGEEGL